jgi:hypothetical protein
MAACVHQVACLEKRLGTEDKFIELRVFEWVFRRSVTCFSSGGYLE